MSRIWTPPSRRNVQLTGHERVVVLVHRKTKRILCFAHEDWFAESLAAEYEIIHLNHAHEYDRYAKMWREQAIQENEAEEYLRLNREDATRQVLRRQLKDRMTVSQPHERQAIEQALRCLDLMQERRKRLHETFTVREAYEESVKDVGETIAHKIIDNA